MIYLLALILEMGLANQPTMIRNYIIIAFRSIFRNKSYAFINIAGLALGITTCLIIFLIMKREMSFDTGFSKANSVYRVVHHATEKI